MEPQLKFTIGRTDSEFRMFLGDEDVTEKFAVEKFSVRLTPQSLTRVELTCYASSIELIPDHVQITVVDQRWEPRLIRHVQHEIAGVDAWYVVPRSEIEEFDERWMEVLDNPPPSLGFFEDLASFSKAYEKYEYPDGISSEEFIPAQPKETKDHEQS